MYIISFLLILFKPRKLKSPAPQPVDREEVRGFWLFVGSTAEVIYAFR